MSRFGINDPIIQPAPSRGPAPSFGNDDPVLVTADGVDAVDLGNQVDRAADQYNRAANVVYGYSDADRLGVEQNFRTLQSKAQAAGVKWTPGQAAQSDAAVTRGRMSGNLARMDEATGDAGATVREQLLDTAESSTGAYTSIAKDQAPGADGILAEQKAWFADPANRGKIPPERLLHMRADPDSGRVKVSPKLGQLLLNNLQTMTGTPNPDAPGLVEDVIDGNARQVTEDQIRRSRDLEARGGVPYELLRGPEAATEFEANLRRPGGVDLGIPEGIVAGFVRGSNQMGADIVGGGGDILADVAHLAGAEGASQTLRGVAHDTRFNLEGVAAANPGSASVGTFTPGNVRWWTESMATQLPNFAAMAAPGLAVGRALEAAGATTRALRAAQGLSTFGSAAAFEASSAYEDVYKRLRATGATEEDARALALTESATIGVINGALEKFAFGEVFMGNHEALDLLQRSVRGFLAEGSTESLQEYVPMAVGKLVESGDIEAPNAQQTAQILSAGIMGGLMGAGAEAAGGAHAAGADQFAAPGAEVGQAAQNPLDLNAMRVAQENAVGPTLGAPPVDIRPPVTDSAPIQPPAGTAGAETVENIPTQPQLPPAETPEEAALRGIFENPTFEDAPAVDDGAVAAALELIARRRAERGETTPAAETGAAPTKTEAVEEPDWSLAAFQDAPPVTDEETAAALARQNVQDRPGEPRGEKMPFETGEAWGTSYDAPRTARVVATHLAKTSNRPVYVVPTRDGYRLDRRRPESPGVVIFPDGSARGSSMTRMDTGARMRSTDPRQLEGPKVQPIKKLEPKPADDGPARFDTENQLGMFAKNADGSAAVIGEKVGQLSMFRNQPPPAPVKAPPTAEEIKREEARAATSPMFDESSIFTADPGPTIIARRRARQTAADAIAKQITGPGQLTTAGVAKATGLTETAARTMLERLEYRDGDAAPVIAARVVEILEKLDAKAHTGADGRSSESPAAAPAAATSSAGGSAAQGDADASGAAAAAAVAKPEERRTLPGKRAGVDPAKGSGAVSGAARKGAEQRPAGRATPGRTSDAPGADVAGKGATAGGRRRGAKGSDAAGRAGGSPAGGSAGPVRGRSSAKTGDGAEAVSRRAAGKEKGVETGYTRRSIQNKLYEELRSQVDAEADRLEAMLDTRIKPLTFANGLPGEVRRMLEGNPLRDKMRKLLSIGDGGNGADTLSDLGDDGFQRLLESLAGNRAALTREIAEKMGTPRQQLLAAMLDFQPHNRAELPKMQHVDPVELPVGTTFSVMGYPMKIVEPEEGDRYVTSNTLRDDLPVDALGAIPVDAGTIKTPADPTGPAAGDVIPFSTGVDLPRELSLLEPQGAQELAFAKRRKAPAGPAPVVPPRVKVAPLAPLPGGQVKKLNEMIHDFAADLNHRIRLHAKMAATSLGFYSPSSQLTTAKNSGDLSTSAHELSHFLDDEFEIVGPWKNNTTRPPFESELVPRFSRYGSTPPPGTPKAIADHYILGEGVAEWLRAYILNPDVAKAEAPLFYAHVRSVLPPGTWSAIEAHSDAVRRWAGDTATAKTIANIRDESVARRPKILDQLKSIFRGDAMDIVKTELTDDKWPLMKAIMEARDLRPDREVTTKNDPETLIRLFSGEDSAIQDAIENGVPRAFTADRRGKGIGGGMDWLLEPLAGIAPTKDLAGMIEATKKGAAYLVNMRAVSKFDLWTQDADVEIADKTFDIESKRDDAIKSMTKSLEAQRDALLRALYKGDPQYAAKVNDITTRAAVTIQDNTNKITARAAAIVKRFEQRTRAKLERKTDRMLGTGAGLVSDMTIVRQSLAELNADGKTRAALTEFGERYQAHAKALLAYMVAKGRLSRQSYREILARNDFYADLHRIVEPNEPAPQKKTMLSAALGQTMSSGPAPLGKALGTTKTLIHRFDGSTLEIGNPIVNLMDQTARVIHETDKGYIINRFVALLTQDRGMHDGPAIDFDSIGAKAEAGDRNATRYFDKGEEKYIVFRPDVKKALDSLGQAPELGFVLRGISAVIKGVPQAGITKSPPFAIRQLFKDAVTRSVISRTGSSVKETFGWFSEEEKSMLARHGGMQAGLFKHDVGWDDRYRQAIADLAKAPNTTVIDPIRWAKAAAGSPMQAWRWYDDSMGYLGDSRTRLAEARKATAVGLQAMRLRANEAKLLHNATLSPAAVQAIKDSTKRQIVELGGEKLLGVRDRYDVALYAASEARSLIDYAKKGATIRKVEPYLMFVNPAIQGPLRTLEAAREKPGKFALRLGAYILVPGVLAMLLRALAGKEDEYQQMPSYRKTFFLNFPLFGRWISIPQPYELSVARAALERTWSKANGEARGFEGLADDAVNSFIPFQLEMPFGGALRAFAENAANWRYYFENSIVPEWEQGKDIRARDTSSASRLGTALSGALDMVNQVSAPLGKDLRVDPRYVDNFISNLGGGMGQFAMKLSDLGRDERPAGQLMQWLTGVIQDTPSFSARDVVAVKRLAVRLGVEKSKELDELRDLLKAVDTAPTILEKNKAAAVARDYATQLRAELETQAPTLLDTAEAKVRERQEKRKADRQR